MDLFNEIKHVTDAYLNRLGLPPLSINTGRILDIPLEFSTLTLSVGYRACTDGFAELVYAAVNEHDLLPYMTQEQRADIQTECQAALDIEIEGVL